MNPDWLNKATRVFQVATVLVVAWLMFQMLRGHSPIGISAQPRSSAIPELWVLPVWAMWFWLLAIASLLVVPSRPIWGVIVYLFVAHSLPVHTPEWIYMLWLHLSTWIAALTGLGWGIWVLREPRRLGSLGHPLMWLMSALVLWYLLAFVASLRLGGGWDFPLQFHPLRVFDIYVLFLVAATVNSRERTLLLIAVAIGSTLILRNLTVQMAVMRDGDIAMLSIMTLVLLLSGLLGRQRWLVRGVSALLGAYMLKLVYMAQNRAAMVAMMVAVIAFLLTSRRKILAMCLTLPMIFGTGWWFLKTPFAARFMEVDGLQKVWDTNQRVQTWKAGVEMGLDHPLLGVGPGNFPSMVADYNRDLMHHSAHNIFVDVLGETGLIGLVLFSVFLGCAMHSAWARWHQNNEMSARILFMLLCAYVAVGTFLTLSFLPLAYIAAGLLLAESSVAEKRFH